MKEVRGPCGSIRSIGPRSHDSPSAVHTELVGQAIGLPPATTNKCLEHLVRLGIVEEITKRRRDRLICYTKRFEILNAEYLFQNRPYQDVEYFAANLQN